MFKTQVRFNLQFNSIPTLVKRSPTKNVAAALLDGYIYLVVEPLIFTGWPSPDGLLDIDMNSWIFFMQKISWIFKIFMCREQKLVKYL